MNEYRGETLVELAGKQYKARLTTNVLANLEDALGLYGQELEDALVHKPGYKGTRALVRCILSTPLELRDRAQIPGLTDDQAGELIDKSGGVRGLRQTYWLILANGGLINKAAAMRAGLIPKEEAGSETGKSPGEPAAAAALVGAGT